jgi:hypothetical protein
MSVQPGNPTHALPAPASPLADPDRPRTSAQIRLDMAAAEERMRGNANGIRRELTLADVNLGGMPVLDIVRRNPLAVVGAAAGAMAFLALLTTLARRQTPVIDRKQQWWDAYMDDFLDDVAVRVGRGGDPEVELSRALRRRAPVIYVEQEMPDRIVKERGAFSRALGSVLKTAGGFGLKLAMDRLTSELAVRAPAPVGSVPVARPPAPPPPAPAPTTAPATDPTP